MAEFHFLRPWFLLALIPVGLVLWLLYRKQREESAWFGVMDAHLLKHLLVANGGQQRLRPIHIVTLLWTLSVIALSGPTWKKQPSPFSDDQAGLVIVLKLSGSMEATDVQPSRLERAKFKIRDLLEKRKGSASALVVYSGSAHLVMPLTKDDSVITIMAEGLTPAVMPSQGDALGDALVLSEKLLQDAGVAGSAIVFADTVDPTQATQLSEKASDLPVQFFAMKSEQSPLDAGIAEAAKVRGGDVVEMTVDQSDVERAHSISASKLLAVSGGMGTEKWQDAGFWLIPVILFGAAFWSRKGWRL